jgi:hypothetical protein
VNFLSKVAVESLDRIVCQENVHVSISIDFMTGERVCICGQRWVEAHPCHVDTFSSEIELLSYRMLFLDKVDVS